MEKSVLNDPGSTKYTLILKLDNSNLMPSVNVSKANLDDEYMLNKGKGTNPFIELILIIVPFLHSLIIGTALLYILSTPKMFVSYCSFISCIENSSIGPSVP